MNETMTNFANNNDLLQRLIDAEVALQVKNNLEDINKPIDNSELFEALARAQANFDQVKKSGKANIPTKTGGNYSYNFAKQQTATQQGTSKPVASTPKPVDKSVETAVESAAKPVEQVETPASTEQAPGSTTTTETKAVEKVEIPKAPERNLDAIFKSGLESAKQFGATEEQLDEWRGMGVNEAIMSMSSFVREQVGK